MGTTPKLRTRRKNAVEPAEFIALLNVIALVTFMLAMGLEVKFAAVTGSVSPVHRVVMGLLANYALVPVVTVALLYLFQANPMVSAGFLILAVCPGAPFGPKAASLAKGDTGWAIGMMVILAGLSAILSPALLGLLLAWVAPESELNIDYVAIVRTLLVTQLLPLAAGLAIHHWLPKLTDKIVKPVSLTANIMLLALVGIILAVQFETLAAIRLRGWTGMALLFVASLAIGWVCGGTEGAIRRALAVTTSCRNAAVSLAIVTGTSHFAGTDAVTAVVAFAFVSIFATLACGALLGKLTRERSDP